MGNPCMNNYAAADGRRFWIVGLQVERHWPPLCRAVGRPDWLTDPRFGTARSRAANAAELIGELDEIFATKPLDEWAKVFAAEPDFFWSPINSIEDVVADEQFHAAGGVVYVPDGDSSSAHDRHAGGFPRHAVGAAFGRTRTRRAHRGNPRRTRKDSLYRLSQNCHADGHGRQVIHAGRDGHDAPSGE